MGRGQLRVLGFLLHYLLLINPRLEKGGAPDFCQLPKATKKKVVGIQSHDVNHFHSPLCGFSFK